MNRIESVVHVSVHERLIVLCCEFVFSGRVAIIYTMNNVMQTRVHEVGKTQNK